MPACEHKKTELLMRRDGVDYIRCLGCDQVFEADDLELLQADESVNDDVQPEPRRKAS
jgi:Zn ribbon nucleic-acid-binding protein